jgi:hypothetical protein
MSQYIGKMSKPFNEQVHRCNLCNTILTRVGRRTKDKKEFYTFICPKCFNFRFFEVEYLKEDEK